MIHFDIAALQNELTDLEGQLGDGSFYADLEKSKAVNKRIKQIKNTLEEYDEITKQLNDIEALLDLSEELNDDSSEGEIVQLLQHRKAPTSSG